MLKNRIVILKVLALALAMLAGFSTAVAGDTNNTSLHGTACTAANPGQAQNFGTSWSQFGIRNPNSVASGRSFFVICPVVINAGPSNSDPETLIRVHAVYQDLSTSVVTCSARRYDVGGNVIKSVAFVPASPIPLDSSIDPFANELTADNVIDSADGQPSFAYNESVTVVCALPPQSGVLAVTTEVNRGE